MTTDLVLIRDTFTLKMCTGVLHYKGTPLLLAGNKIYFGEDAARPDGVKIQNETAIWAGEYWLAMTFSERFQKVLPLIYNDEATLACVSGKKQFTGVRQHPGNTEADTEACQLTGLGRNLAGVWQSGDAMKLYLPWITELVKNNGGKVRYQIINAQA